MMSRMIAAQLPRSAAALRTVVVLCSASLASLACVAPANLSLPVARRRRLLRGGRGGGPARFARGRSGSRRGRRPGWRDSGRPELRWWGRRRGERSLDDLRLSRARRRRDLAPRGVLAPHRRPSRVRAAIRSPCSCARPFPPRWAPSTGGRSTCGRTAAPAPQASCATRSTRPRGTSARRLRRRATMRRLRMVPWRTATRTPAARSAPARPAAPGGPGGPAEASTGGYPPDGFPGGGFYPRDDAAATGGGPPLDAASGTGPPDAPYGGGPSVDGPSTSEDADLPD